jgi:hypothetical protein
MNILAAIKREPRKLEKRVGKLQGRLEGLAAAAKSLGKLGERRLGWARKRVMSAAARAKISATSSFSR